jgi:quinoprotein glucose dehydrogenase
VIALSLLVLLVVGQAQTGGTDWPAYGRDPGGSRYSPLKQIDRSNVKSLRVAWTYRTGEDVGKSVVGNKAAFEATPIMIDGTLYLSTPFNRVIALDAETGKRRWALDPRVSTTTHFSEVTSRGVSTWPARGAKARGERRRILVATIDARLIALAAATGEPAKDFGSGGQVDLTQGVRLVSRGDSPGSAQWGSVNLGGSVVTGGGLVFIAAAMDNHLRAFDVETGRELAKWELPAGGQATPMTYQLSKDGKQFLVICAGGHGKMGTKIGDYVVAFALP